MLAKAPSGKCDFQAMQEAEMAQPRRVVYCEPGAALLLRSLPKNV